jgi:hypothetical protein
MNISRLRKSQKWGYLGLLKKEFPKEACNRGSIFLPVSRNPRLRRSQDLTTTNTYFRSNEVSSPDGSYFVASPRGSFSVYTLLTR